MRMGEGWRSGWWGGVRAKPLWFPWFQMSVSQMTEKQASGDGRLAWNGSHGGGMQGEK